LRSTAERPIGLAPSQAGRRGAIAVCLLRRSCLLPDATVLR